MLVAIVMPLFPLLSSLLSMHFVNMVRELGKATMFSRKYVLDAFATSTLHSELHNIYAIDPMDAGIVSTVFASLMSQHV